MKLHLFAVLLLLCFTTMATAQLQWTNLSNVTISGNGNNTLTNNGGGYWEDAAFSIHSIPAGTDGYLQFTATAGDFVMGLSSEDGPSYYSINYGIMVQGGNIYVAENNNGGSPVSTYTAEDALRIERQGTTIRYLKNGITFYTSSVSSTSALFVDCSLNSVGSTISGIYFSPAESTTTYPVVWSELVNVVLTPQNTLIKTVGSQNNWDCGAGSINLLPASTDGYLEFAYSTSTGYYMLGLSTINGDATYASTDYALYISATDLLVYEHGASIAYLGTLSDGDILRIARQGLAINYYKNGSLLHTTTISAAAAANELRPDISIASYELIIPPPTVSFGTRLFTISPEYTLPTLASTSDGSIVVTPEGGNAPYTYQWSSGETTPSISNKPQGSYSLVVTDASGSTISATYYLGYPVAWANLENMTVNPNGSLTKIINTNDWSAGASSLNVLPPGSDGFMELTVTEYSSFIIGLSDFDPDMSYTNIDYAVYVDGNRYHTMIAGGREVRSFNVVKKGDVFRIAREGAAIVFYHNGVQYDSSPVENSVPLLVDISILTAQVAIPVISTSFEKQIRFKPVFTFSDNSNTNGSVALSVMGTYTPTVINWLPGNETSYLITEKERGTYTATVTDGASRTFSRTYRLGYPVTWTSVQNARINGDNSISQTGGDGWQAGASSANFLPANADGWIEFVVGRGAGNKMIGLSKVNTTAYYTSIDYALYTENGNSLYIYELGVLKGFFGYVQEGDVLAIAREDGNINYYLNGAIVRTSETPIPDVLIIDVSLYANPESNSPIVSSSFGRTSQTFYAIANGNWNDVNTWSLSETGPAADIYPSITDVVNIKGFNVNVNSGVGASQLNIVVINDATSLNVDSPTGELTVRVEITIQGVSNTTAVKALIVQNQGKITVQSP